MRCFLLSVVGGLLVAAVPVGAAPLFSGYSNGSYSRLSWFVYADDAADNPHPQAGEYTYVYQEDALAGSFTLYELVMIPPYANGGEITSTGYIPGTGTAPTAVGSADWGFSGAPIIHTASLYFTSPDEPGPVFVTPWYCNPMICDPPSRSGVGPLAVRIPGDYNVNGTIDANDFWVWRIHFGTTGPLRMLRGDGNDDGVVDAADYTVWRDHFSTSGAGALATPVPEPSLGVSLAIAALVMMAACRRRATS